MWWKVPGSAPREYRRSRGFSFDHVVLGEQLPVEDPQVFSRIMDLTKLLNKYSLAADKIYLHSSGDITIYFGQIKGVHGQ